MKRPRHWLPLLAALAFASVVLPAQADSGARRIFIVSSYHAGYLWSQSTQAGLNQALLDYGYFSAPEHADSLLRDDYVETPKAVVKKVWMDTKRHHSERDMARATERILRSIVEFQPDLVMLGDDNAANYIGNQLLDTDTPAVFWGINGLPLKYGLVDSMDAPGHNVTGVWQMGYIKESVDLLHQLVPEARTFAVLACDSVSARPKAKQLRALALRGELPLELTDTVLTNSYSEFQRRALELAERVDAFFVLNHDTLVDDAGRHVDMLEAGRWYLENIDKPEASHEGQFVHEGMLASVSDSGFNQGYVAFQMAYDILEQGLNPGRMRTRTPPRGPLMVNRQRAEMLGIRLDGKLDLFDEIVAEAIALK